MFKVNSNTDFIKLVELSKTLKLDQSQFVLLKQEDELAKQFVYNSISDLTDDVKHYLLLTSLPFVINSKPKIELEKLWPIDCKRCTSVVYRHTMPTGNLKPKYFVVGDAPGIGDGELTDRFDRKWVYGHSSHLLRKALNRLGIYRDCWFSNLLKCSTQSNRPSFDSEIQNCSTYLKTEIEHLEPHFIIFLGNHTNQKFDRQLSLSSQVIKIYHPSYFVRSGLSFIDYANHIVQVFEKCKLQL